LANSSQQSGIWLLVFGCYIFRSQLGRTRPPNFPVEFTLTLIGVESPEEAADLRASTRSSEAEHAPSCAVSGAKRFTIVKPVERVVA
jgi:hypothetical protein